MITTQVKVQLISFLVAIALLGGLYVLVSADSPKEAPAPQDDSAYLIMIESATYGENCTAFIEHNNTLRERSNPPRPQLAPIKQNNTLRLVSSICSGQPECRLYVTPQTVGFDPAPRCAKELRIGYRCFSFDRSREVVILDGNEINFSCNSQ